MPQQKKSIGPNGTDQKRVGKKIEAILLAVYASYKSIIIINIIIVIFQIIVPIIKL